MGDAGEFLIRSLPGSAKAIRIEIQTANDETLVLPEVPVANGDSEPS